MRAIVLLVVLGAAGCCWDEDSACVYDSGRCYDFVDRCPDPDVPYEPTPCYGSARSGTCASRGYTEWCDGYSVQPGHGC
jgi:hypothetical protein